MRPSLVIYQYSQTNLHGCLEQQSASSPEPFYPFNPEYLFSKHYSSSSFFWSAAGSTVSSQLSAWLRRELNLSFGFGIFRLIGLVLIGFVPLLPRLPGDNSMFVTSDLLG